MASSVHIITFVLFCGLFYVSQGTLYVRKDCSRRADIGFILDESQSIYYRDFNRQKQFVKDVVDKFIIGPQNIRVGVITFSNRARKIFGFEAYSSRTKLKAAINDITQVNGQTFTNLALDMARTDLFSQMRPGVNQIAIVITDGDPDKRTATALKASELRDMGVNIIAIGVGDKVQTSQLHEMASEPKEQNVFQVIDYRALDSLKTKLSAIACIVTTPRPPTTTTTTPTTTVTPTTSPKYLTNCPGTKKLDVMFGLPLTASSYHTGLTIDFIQGVVDELSIEPNQVRAGLIPRILPSVQKIHLNESYNKQQFIGSLNRRRPAPGAKTHQLLEYLDGPAFLPEREGVIRTAVLVLDMEASHYNHTMDLAERLRRKQKPVRLITVAVGPYGYEKDEASKMAWIKTFFTRVPSYEELYSDSAIDSVLTLLCESMMAKPEEEIIKIKINSML